MLLGAVLCGGLAAAAEPEPLVSPPPIEVHRYWAGRNVSYFGLGMGGAGLSMGVGGIANEQPFLATFGFMTMIGGGFVVTAGATRSRTALIHMGVDVPNGALICGWVGSGVFSPLGYACAGAQMAVNDKAYWEGRPRDPSLFTMSVSPGMVGRHTGGLVISGTW